MATLLMPKAKGPSADELALRKRQEQSITDQAASQKRQEELLAEREARTATQEAAQRAVRGRRRGLMRYVDDETGSYGTL